uniref:Uncharacterized protein n=1 Tax=Lepeophtheirus salmonis TaxID=72036 RepID=A0A0K2UAS7_LEPSM
MDRRTSITINIKSGNSRDLRFLLGYDPGCFGRRGGCLWRGTQRSGRSRARENEIHKRGKL